MNNKHLNFPSPKQRKNKLSHFYIKLCQHCNLNCKGCDEFSPIAKPEFINPIKLENDLKRLSILTKKNVNTIILSGGETLLYPKIENIIEIVKKYFPNTYIELFTNGILLEKMSKNFFDICRKYRVLIVVEKYPIKLDYKKIFTKIASKKVFITQQKIIGGGEQGKTLWHLPLDLEGNGDIDINFENCMHANHCTYLFEGKLYPCSIVGNIRHFNTFFNKNLQVTKNDYIDIYKIKNVDEILDFLSNIHE